jgi:hypothetical protein
MAYGTVARALRRCTATTKAGEPCQQFAVWSDEAGRCAAHGGRVLGPRTYERTAYTPCRCLAYRFPHRPASGLCEWPNAPLETLKMSPGTHSGGAKERKVARMFTNEPTVLFFHRLERPDRKAHEACGR